MTPRTRRLALGGVSLLLLGVVTAAVATRLALGWLHDPLATLIRPVAYEIPRGTPLSAIARDLAARGVIEHPRVFSLWARLSGQARSIKAGEYELLPGSTPQSLLELFNSGKVLLHALTIIEGTTFADLRRALAADPNLRQDTATLESAEIMARLGAAERHPEGQFYPDTYRFPRATSDFDLLRIAYRRMQDELTRAWDSRADDLPFSSPYEALILASIVEKETGLDTERPQIAGVFVERLRRGMRLETDPSVIYGLTQQNTYDGDLRRADLRRDTPYNTYTRFGLPPTPIALPGAAALQAVVRPEVTGALFFVATGLGDGSHQFSKTYAEHEAALGRYLQRLRQRETRP